MEKTIKVITIILLSILSYCISVCGQTFSDKPIARLGERGTVSGFDYSPDGKLLAIALGWVEIWLYDAYELQKISLLQENGKLAEDFPDGCDVAFSPDGKTLAVAMSYPIAGSAGSINKVILLNITTQETIAEMALDKPEIDNIKFKFSPSGEILALHIHETYMDSYSNYVAIWNFAGKNQIATQFLFTQAGSLKTFASADFSPDGQTMALLYISSNKISLWHIQDQKEIPLSIIGENILYPISLAFSPDGITLAFYDQSIFSEGEVYLWDVNEKNEIGAFGNIHNAFSPDGRIFAYDGGDGIHLWDIAERRDINVLREIIVFGDTEYYAGGRIKFHPDGNLLASLILDRTVLLWGEIRPNYIQPKIRQTELLQNYPNPFNPETWIPFELEEESDVTLRIYDVKGILVREISLGKRPAGSYIDKAKAIYWDGRNESHEDVTSGTYFYSIETGDFTNIRKMIILR